MPSSRSENHPPRADQALDEIAMRQNLLALCAALGAASAAKDDQRYSLVAAALRDMAAAARQPAPPNPEK